MKNVFLILFIVAVISFVIFVEVMINKGKLVRVDKYSYKPVFKRSMIHLSAAIAISLSIYLISKSIEASVTIGILLFFGVVGGFFYGLLWEYQTKRRGGKRVD